LRIPQPAEADVDHARAHLQGPTDRPRLGSRRDRAVGPDDLRDEQVGGRREARDPVAVVHGCGDLSRDEGPVTLVVGGRAPDEAARRDDLAAAQVGVLDVDARVDHRHPNRREELQDVERVEGLVLLGIPLLRQEWIVGCERLSGGRHEQREQSRRDEERFPHCTTSVSESPTAKPCPGATRAR
jgi:hypothetical protein